MAVSRGSCLEEMAGESKGSVGNIAKKLNARAKWAVGLAGTSATPSVFRSQPRLPIPASSGHPLKVGETKADFCMIFD